MRIPLMGITMINEMGITMINEVGIILINNEMAIKMTSFAR